MSKLSLQVKMFLSNYKRTRELSEEHEKMRPLTKCMSLLIIDYDRYEA